MDPFFAQPSPRMLAWQNAMRRLGLFALLALALTPLLMDPLARDDAYMAPKWAWIAICTGLALAAAAAGAVAGRAARFELSEVWIAALVFAAWHWVAVVWAASPSLAVERAGRVTWVTLAMWAMLQSLTTRRHLRRLFKTMLAVGCATAAWALLEDGVHGFLPGREWIRPNLADWRGYIAAGLGNTNHIGDLLALTLLATLAAFGRARRRRFVVGLGAALVLLASALTVCVSLGSTLGLVSGALTMFALLLAYDRGRTITRRPARWAGLLAAWGAMLAFFLIDHPLNPHPGGLLAQAFGSARLMEGGPTRLAIWAQTLEMIRLHPWMGVGAGNFTYVFPTMDSQLISDPRLLAYQGMWTNAAHNMPLQAWAELGMVGLFLLLALLGSGFYVALKGLGAADRVGAYFRIAMTGMLTAICAQGMMNFVMQHPVGLLTLYGVLAAIAIEKRARPERGAMPPLCYETGLFAIRVDWRDMSKPTAVGLALLLPEPLAIVAGVALLVAAAAAVVPAVAPVRAQREYRVASSPFAPAEVRERHYLRALEIAPHAHDVRSSYSSWLVEQRRHEEALEQIATLRERLNGNELHEREARALAGLGRMEQARAAHERYMRSMWQLRRERSAPDG